MYPRLLLLFCNFGTEAQSHPERASPPRARPERKQKQGNPAGSVRLSFYKLHIPSPSSASTPKLNRQSEKRSYLGKEKSPGHCQNNLLQTSKSYFKLSRQNWFYAQPQALFPRASVSFQRLSWALKNKKRETANRLGRFPPQQFKLCPAALAKTPTHPKKQNKKKTTTSAPCCPQPRWKSFGLPGKWRAEVLLLLCVFHLFMKNKIGVM